MAAVILGVMALRRIRFAHGQLGGRKLALAGTLIGSAMLVVQVGGLSAFTEHFEVVMDNNITTSVQTAVNGAQSGRIDEVARVWSDSAASSPSPESIRRLGRESLNRYGELKDVAIVSQSTEGVLAPKVTVALIYTFENKRVVGSATLVPATGTNLLFPSWKIVELSIADTQQDTKPLILQSSRQ